MFTEQGGAGQGAVEKSPLHRGPRTAAYRPLEPEKATESAWLTLLLKIHLIGWKLMADLQECSGAKPEWAGGSKCVCERETESARVRSKCGSSSPDRSFDYSLTHICT